MAFMAYRKLVTEVDQLSEPLFDRYRSHLQCRKGCYFCCSKIAVLPVEHHAVHRWLQAHSPRREPAASPGAPGRARDRTVLGTLPVAPGEEEGRCAMLAGDGVCSVYPVRPVICRVHGLPLAYPVYEYDQEGRRLTGEKRMELWCDLNFTELSEEGPLRLFDEHGRVDMVALNGTLEAINSAFLESEEGAPYAGVERLTLGEVAAEVT